MDFSTVLEQLREISGDIVRLLPALGIALLVFGIFVLISRSIRRIVRRVSERRQRHRYLALVLGRLAQWGIVILGLLVAVTILLPTFRPGDLVTLLGISGIAVGFVFKDIFQNFLAGILILMTRPFRVGDQIIVGDFEGTVQEIQTRATFIRTYDGRRVVIPNADLYTEKVTVNTAFPILRVQYDVGIGYGDDIERATELILEAVRGADGVLSDPVPEAFPIEFAESSLNLRIWWWSRSERVEVLRVQGRVLKAIKATLSENGIDLPYPTRQVLFHDQTEATDGDRSRQREGWPAGQGDVPEPLRIASEIRASAKASQRGDREPDRST